MPLQLKLWHSLLVRHVKSIRSALDKGLRALDSVGQQRVALEPVLIRNTPKQPLHQLARIRQTQSRWYSSARCSLDITVRHFSSAGRKAHIRYDRASLPKSTIGSCVRSSPGRAPFASTLRPSLTGGTLGRTAGGYTTGSGRIGGARYFSHGPASQAQVVQNVSQAVRAFLTSGHKAQFDGVSKNGDKKFKPISALQGEAGRKIRHLPQATPGSRIVFSVNPIISALTSLSSVNEYTDSTVQANHLNTDSLLDVLSADFSRSLKDLSAVLHDLKSLSALGDIPLTYEGSQLCVHFPGCDAETIERLCEDLHVQRGCIVQDESFDSFAGSQMALLFPFAPCNNMIPTDYSETVDIFYSPSKLHMAPGRYLIDLDDMLSSCSPPYSTLSESGFEDVIVEQSQQLSSPSGYQSIRTDSAHESDQFSPFEYQGFEGIYRFIEELDSVRR